MQNSSPLQNWTLCHSHSQFWCQPPTMRISISRSPLPSQHRLTNRRHLLDLASDRYQPRLTRSHQDLYSPHFPNSRHSQLIITAASVGLTPPMWTRLTRVCKLPTEEETYSHRQKAEVGRQCYNQRINARVLRTSRIQPALATRTHHPHHLKLNPQQNHHLVTVQSIFLQFRPPNLQSH